jgi:hypothetical protein
MEQVHFITPFFQNLAAMVVFPFDLWSATVKWLKPPIVTWLLGHHTGSCAAHGGK